MVILNGSHKWFILMYPSPCFQETAPNLGYCNKYMFLFFTYQFCDITAAENRTLGRGKLMNSILVPLKFLFGTIKHTQNTYTVDKLLGVALLQEVDSIYCEVLLCLIVSV